MMKLDFRKTFLSTRKLISVNILNLVAVLLTPLIVPASEEMQRHFRVAFSNSSLNTATLMMRMPLQCYGS